MIKHLSLLALSVFITAPLSTTTKALKTQQQEALKINSETENARVSYSKDYGDMIDADTEDTSEEQISKFSLLPNNWQFFTKLDSENKIGYYAIENVLFSKESDVSDNNKSKYQIGPGKGGLCEYVSLVMLYKYFHIYGKNSYFTQEQIK